MKVPLLEISNLTVKIKGMSVLRGVNISVHPSETLALVGESGCGKSMTALSIMGLLPKGGHISGGIITFSKLNITHLPEREMRKIRGNKISIIFQEPTTSLNPLMTVRKQLIEAILSHQAASPQEAEEHAEEMLHLVGIPDPKMRLKQYSFELSGGMCQRVMIAIALSCQPELLIADEPTTALDVTIQAQILDLIGEIKSKQKTAILLITHDLGVVADMADHVAVMYGGLVVEYGSVFEILGNPHHPYTKLLLTTIPQLDGVRKAKLATIEGMVPDAHSWPMGCLFHPRCPLADDQCRQTAPTPEAVGTSDHQVACWHHTQVNGLGV